MCAPDRALGQQLIVPPASHGSGPTARAREQRNRPVPTNREMSGAMERVTPSLG
tara:strand:+ start:3230 stop:3391 length:162 start_codon:yes stop_codon:yes gene_type:complete